MKILALIPFVFLAACNIDTDTASKVEARQQEEMSKQAVESVGMPAITHWQEKRILKNILELRDQQIKTVTYTQDLNAGLHKLCDSIGYGIPYATQYTSPLRAAHAYETYEQGNIALPQADPNGLYSPASADGTWVMCLNPDTKELAPVYVEPHVVVSPFPLTTK